MSSQPTRVRRVDPTDEASVAAWYDVLRRALDDRGEDAALPLEDLREALSPDGSGVHALACTATDEDGTLVGALLMEYDDEEAPDTVEVDIAVLPQARRRGHGTALLRAAEAVGSELGRTVQVVEVSAEPDHELKEEPGGGFALAHGFEVEAAEDLLVLELPVSGTAVELGPGGGAVVTGWLDTCPDELVEPCARLREALEPDADEAPEEASDVESYTERVRLAEALRAEEGVHSLVAVALDGAGGAVGLSELVLWPDSETAEQAGTLVLDAHEDSDLGTRLRLHNLEELARRFPERTRVHTWTDPEDTAVGETEAALGFRPVERTYALRRTL